MIVWAIAKYCCIINEFLGQIKKIILKLRKLYWACRTAQKDYWAYKIDFISKEKKDESLI